VLRFSIYFKTNINAPSRSLLVYVLTIEVKSCERRRWRWL